MATLVSRSPAVQARSATPPHLTLNTSSLNPTSTLNTSVRGTPTAIPNKYLPICSPGPQPTSSGLLSPPASPPSKSTITQSTSLLHPPDSHGKISEVPPVYAIDAAVLAASLDHIATQPLPDPRQVFPWMHGLHAENHIQLAFFIARKKANRKVPKCLRGLTIVKAGGDLSRSKLKGAIAPEELVSRTRFGREAALFHEIDPKIGFSVRNFHIQTCKMATVSDIVVYGDDRSTKREVENLARLLSQAQKAWRDKIDPEGSQHDRFNTFVVTDPFETFEKNHPELVAADSKGQLTGVVMDFPYQERVEMCSMSKASEISRNVWLGPTPDPALHRTHSHLVDESHFDLIIEAADDARTPDSQMIEKIESFFRLSTFGFESVSLSYPSSGSIVANSWGSELERMLEVIKGLYRIANPQRTVWLADKDTDGDSVMMDEQKPRKILIHCQDGYTETSLLALSYLMYAEGIPAHEAWLRMHKEKGRNFFAYPTDVDVLKAMEARILQESPAREAASLAKPDPSWMSKMDGSLPSRILPYLYLGNLTHANNPELLKEMGITRILSVGEAVDMSEKEREDWGLENLLYIDKVQDNGVDPLTVEFDRCLEFIEKGKQDGHATLVHCRVGVSRSATICIAEVMNELGLSYPRAYCFVRARRLNVIIQPHLRFSYELLKWEEFQADKRNKPLRRELEWATIAREIAAMNRPYARQ